MRRISLRYIFHRWRVCIVRVYILMMSLLSFVFVWSGFWCRQREKAKCFQIQLDKQNDRQMEMNFTFCFRVRSLRPSPLKCFSAPQSSNFGKKRVITSKLNSRQKYVNKLIRLKSQKLKGVHLGHIFFLWRGHKWSILKWFVGCIWLFYPPKPAWSRHLLDSWQKHVLPPVKCAPSTSCVPPAMAHNCIVRLMDRASKPLYGKNYAK